MTELTVQFTAYGTPAPQGSKKAYVVRGGTHANVVDTNPGKLRPWRQTVTQAALDALNGRPPLTGPVVVDVAFRLARPATHYRTGRNRGELKPSAPPVPDNGPDLDKLARAVLDSLTDAGVFLDDRQVQQLTAAKRYTDRAWPALATPGATIIVNPAT